MYVQHKPHAQITCPESHCFPKTNYLLIYSPLLTCWLQTFLCLSYFCCQTALQNEDETLRRTKYVQSIALLIQKRIIQLQFFPKLAVVFWHGVQGRKEATRLKIQKNPNNKKGVC